MKQVYPVRSSWPLKENISMIVPLVYDDFISMAEKVAARPRMKSLLHRMRINGKPMRYAMELVESSFGKEFKICLKEVKEMLEVMGDIHDCDVHISELLTYLNELRSFNRTIKNKIERISTRAVIEIISGMRERRKMLFEKFCIRIGKWQNEDFKDKLISSMC